MILKALDEYYDRLTLHRKNEDEADVLPGWGWILQRIDFAIVLKKNGSFFQLEDKRDDRDGKPISTLFFVPNIGKQSIKHTNAGNDANLLWDNTGFVLGIDDKKGTKLDSFIEAIETRMAGVNDDAVKAVLTFLKAGKKDPQAFDKIVNHSQYGEIIRSPYTNVTFQMLDDNYFIFERPAIKERVSKQNEFEELYRGVCLVTGKSDQPIVRNHNAVKSLGGDKDPLLISFNNESFNSYGKEGGGNSPVGFKAASQSYKALSHLLRKHSIAIGKTKTVFWAARKTPLEEIARDSIQGYRNKKDNPDRKSEQIRAILESYRTGNHYVDGGNNRFHVLGLEPLSARIAVRLWIVDTTAGIATKLLKHQEDTAIFHPGSDRDVMIPFWRYWNVLRPPKKKDEKGNKGKKSEEPTKGPTKKSEAEAHREKVELQFIRSVFMGLPYPRTMLEMALRRARIEVCGESSSWVLHTCAAFMKGYFSRWTNNKGIIINKELDMKNSRTPYRLGRLFAVLERIQWLAHKISGESTEQVVEIKATKKTEEGDGKKKKRLVNATIVDRYYGAASQRPASGFPRAMHLVATHLAKIDKSEKGAGLCKFYDEMIQEIVNGPGEDNLLVELPAVLKPEEQAEFFLGYYQQKFYMSPKAKQKDKAKKSSEK